MGYSEENVDNGGRRGRSPFARTEGNHADPGAHSSGQPQVPSPTTSKGSFSLPLALTLGPQGSAPRAVSHWETVKEEIGSLVRRHFSHHISFIYSCIICTHTHMNTYTRYDAHKAVRRQLVEASSLMRVLEIKSSTLRQDPLPLAILPIPARYEKSLPAPTLSTKDLGIQALRAFC